MVTESSRSNIEPFHVMDVFKAAALRTRTHGDVLSLAAGQPSTSAPGPVLQATRDALDGHLLGYTETLGILPLREAIARYHAAEAGVPVDADDVVVTTGSSGAFTLLFLAAFDIGDTVVMARPGYPAYRNTLAALGCRVVELDCGPQSRFQPTVAMLESLPEPPKGLIIASPANPTGTIIDPIGQAIAGSAHFAIATPENYRFHPALPNFDFMTLYPLAAGIEHDEKAPWAVTDLVEIARDDWAETGPIEAKVGFDEGTDRRGPFVLAAAFTRSQGEREQRVVVVGDGDFLSNAYVGNGGNLNLGLNLVNWLSTDEGLVNIPPRTAADTDLALSRDNSLLIGFGFLFLMPAAFAAAGLGVWLRRRGR